MKNCFWLLVFLLLASAGLEARESVKITEALDSESDAQNTPELILEPEETPIETIKETPIETTEETPAEQLEPKQGGAHSILTPENPAPNADENQPNTDAETESEPVSVAPADLIPFNPAQNVPAPVETPTPTELIPFHPSDSIPAAQETVIADPAQAISELMKKYNFPYDFIQIQVLNQNAASRPTDDGMQMEIPMILSFNSELFATFQTEMKALLEQVTLSPAQNTTLSKPARPRNPGRKNIYFSIHSEGDLYTTYELPGSCREVLAEYAALLPVADLTLFDGQQNVLAKHFFPLLYRDIVKAYPINLMGVYQSDYQTLRIFPHQADAFAAFIQSQGSSFVIPERFTIISSHSSSAPFLAKFTKHYHLESTFRRGDRFPEIPLVIQIQVPVEQFRQIRFMKCTIASDSPGETAVQPTESFEITEEEWRKMNENSDAVETPPTTEPLTEPLTKPATEPMTILETPVTDAPESEAENVTSDKKTLNAAAIQSAPRIESEVRQILAQRPSVTLSYFGESERNITLNATTVQALAQTFRITKLEKKEIFRTSPELDLPSLGWLEISPGVSIMFLYPTPVTEENRTLLTSKVALWFSLDDGTVALVMCDLSSEFVQRLNQELDK